MAKSTQWQLARDAAERYERILVPAILGPAARALVEWSSLSDGEAVLDVGCGTGAAARFAAEKVRLSGRVAGVDVNAGMLDVAQSLTPRQGATIEWFENTAYQLPFREGDFDVALCAQTLQFLEDTKHIGAETAAGLDAAFGLSDSETIRSLVTGAGFENVKATVQHLDLELPAPQDFVPLHVSATPMSTGFYAATEEARHAVVYEVSQRLAPFGTDQGIRAPFRTHLVMGVKG
jgi:SAM-dependent methyltransferase